MNDMQASFEQLKEQLRGQLGSKLNGQVIHSPGFKVWLVRVVNLLAIALLASILAKLTWMWLSPDNNSLSKTAINQGGSPLIAFHMAAHDLHVHGRHVGQLQHS